MKNLLLLATLFTSLSVNASYFEQLNGFIDNDCPVWKIERFKNVKKWSTIGVWGATKSGYDYEVPISRKGVDAIWCALRPDRGIDNKSCHGVVDLFSNRPFAAYADKSPIEGVHMVSYASLEDQYEVFLRYVKLAVKREKISRPNVGSVLEILSRYYLQDLTGIYPKNIFNIGSGVAYYERRGERTIGELDIIVYDKVTCSVIMVGESKASGPRNLKRSLSKAKSQLKRFRDFEASN